MPIRSAALVLLATLTLNAEDLKDVEYARAGKYSLTLDAHIPDGKGPFSAVILVHGGAWVAGDRITSVMPLFQPLSKAGFAWFTISYRLAGDILRNPVGTALRLGTAENDVRSAVAFVRENAARYRVDPNKIALIGASAGGQLASMAALSPDPGTSVSAVVLFYTPTDLPTLARTSFLIPANLRDAVEGSKFATLLTAGLADLSPINHVSASAPPFLLIHGTDDNIVPFTQSERFCQALHKAGASCDLIPVEGAGHGMVHWKTTRANSYQLPMIHWLRQTLAQSRPKD